MARTTHHRSHKVIEIKSKKHPLFIDRLIYIAAIVEPLFSLPQAYRIFSTGSAGDISLLSWTGFEFMTAIWIWWAIVHKDKMVLIYQGLFLIIDGSILVGAMMYGASW